MRSIDVLLTDWGIWINQHVDLVKPYVGCCEIIINMNVQQHKKGRRYLLRIDDDTGIAITRAFSQLLKYSRQNKDWNMVYYVMYELYVIGSTLKQVQDKYCINEHKAKQHRDKGQNMIEAWLFAGEKQVV